MNEDSRKKRRLRNHAKYEEDGIIETKSPLV
jgi:hypothetical protein